MKQVLYFDPRSQDYGHSFTNIDGYLDTSDNDPLLWPAFYVSEYNLNMVSH